MKLSNRAPGLARLAGTAVLMTGLAGTMATGAPGASASVNFPGINQKAAVSWGSNSAGTLGNGTTTDRTLPGPVSGLAAGIVQVAAGFIHGLALRTDGTVWAWGNNAAGELGDGTTRNRTTPVQVMGLTGVVAVSAGIDFSLALRSDGTVWAWGYDTSGQLGNGVISAAQLTPVQVTGLTGVTKIAAGGAFGLALRKDGTVWAWGSNAYGELGDGTTASSSVPVRVTGLSQVRSIAAAGGSSSSFAVRTSSTGVTSLWAWGDNSEGELGDGTLNARLAPEQITGFSVPGIADLAAGTAFTLLLGTDGSVWAWGINGYGQLGGAPSAQVSNRPARTIAPDSGIIRLTAGVTHALAVRSNGTVLAWGDNRDGELGDGSGTAASGPVQVTGLTGATQVSAGSGSSLAAGELPPVASP